MKKTLLMLSLAACSVHAADSQTIDLGNGTSVEVKDGKVSVKSNASGEGNQSASSSVQSSSNGDGTTTATVTSERNGQRVTRTITIGKDGQASVNDAPASEKPAAPSTPGKADNSKGGWLGVHTTDVTAAVRAQVDLPEDQGVIVEFIAAGGPAAKAGLAVNDIILSLNSEPVKNVEDFRAKLSKLAPGAQAGVEYMRKGKSSTATATLAQRPPDAPADDKVTGEAGRLLKDLHGKDGKGGTSRTVIVGPDGKTTVVESKSGSSSSSSSSTSKSSSSSSSSSSSGGNGGSTGDQSGTEAFDALLNDPNVPEEMKEHIRKTQEEFKKLQEGQKP